MLPVWASKKLRSQQWRPPFQLEKQPSMAPAKKKASAGTTSNTVEQHEQHEEANTRVQDTNNKAVLHGDLVDDIENTEAHQNQSKELTETALKLKALEMKKRNIEAQLATKKRALDQANKLAEARRKLAEMEAEVENLQRAYQEMPEGSLQQENRIIYQTTFAHNEDRRPPPVNLPYDPTSPLSVALQRTSWPPGYKPTQLPSTMQQLIQPSSSWPTKQPSLRPEVTTQPWPSPSSWPAKVLWPTGTHTFPRNQSTTSTS